MSNYGNALSDGVIKERAAKKGFTVVDIDRTKEVPYVTMKCPKGHIRGCSARVIHTSSTICPICDGKRYDLEKATKLLNSFGYRFKEKPKLEKDRFGNTVLKAATRFIAVCPNGHEQSLNLTEFVTGKRCTSCSGTVFNTGYSRSEEIIARVLDYIGVPYERQAKTGEQFENLCLDFFLPNERMIIEYDGEHHVYGRSPYSEEKLKDIQRKDKVRDAYAEHIGFRMIRINHNFEGKAIVYALATLFDEIDPNDPYYDKIVREVFNEAAERFGWLSYEDIKYHADTYLNNSLSRSSDITGISQTVIARHFRWVYGMNKADYIKIRNMVG